MFELRKSRTGPSRPVRNFLGLGSFAAALALSVGAAAIPAPAQAQTRVAAGQDVSDFYRARDGRPLWFGQPGQQPEMLVRMFASASVDGLNPSRYPIEALSRAIADARSGNRKAMRRADMLLSQTFVAYVRDLRRPANVGTIFVDQNLRTSAPSARAILDSAARQRSLERYVAQAGWMHPLYGQLRNVLASAGLTEQQRGLLRVNLERARELPAGNTRHILVNAAAQRLFMYEDGRAVDSMRVVIGKPIYPTPMMAANVRFASLNPYWYVPPDLASERIAPNVLKQGMKYLDRQGYEVVHDFVDNPRIIDPTTVDWKGVADGKVNVLIRQKPGPHNSMGRIKFMFPNEQGVYLHDNPERELFEQAARLYSGGCVRLEDAWRLSRWIFNRDLTWEGAGTEERVMLEKPVPVYITYLTAVPDGSNVAYFDDVYGRDKKQLAAIDGSGSNAAVR